MSNKKDDDQVIDVEEENSFEFSQETEMSVQKPGLADRRKKQESRAVTSQS